MTAPASGEAGRAADGRWVGLLDAWSTRVLLLAAAAVLLRLLLFLGRGDYVAFDEGFYLLLGRSLATGDGFSLVGIPHTTLSPLFPILAGAVGRVLGDWVWGGRVVAAIAAGLLVLPCWAIFRRIAVPRTAFIACLLVAVLPSMAPFVVPYWIGADLWVGAEPLLHLLLFAAIALWLRADERGGPLTWALTGATFALAFLARPEAIITWGLLGLAAVAIAVWRRSARHLIGAVVMAVGFAVLATPYWIYLHDASGRWTLTGRGVTAASAAAAVAPGGRSGAAGTIEQMLWLDDTTYQERLYALDETGLRLASSYWGVYPEPLPRTLTDEVREPAADTAAAHAADTTRAAGSGAAAAAPSRARRPSGAPTTLGLYFRSMGRILPLLLWAFVILGMAQPRARDVLRRELPISAALMGTSIAVAALVAVDPRTQLFLVPLLAFYAARGFSLVEQQVQQRARGTGVRPGLVELLLATIAVVWLLSIDARRLYFSLAIGSPHHVVGEQNRTVAEELDTLLEGRASPVMSWHPALAVFGDHDWRVLPFADMAGIIRYAGASGAAAIVLSAYYPPDIGIERAGIRYLLIDVPEEAERVDGWTLQITPGDSIRAVGRLEAVD